MGRFILGEITPKDLVVDSRQIDEILVALRKEGQMPKSSVVQLEQGLYEGTPAGREVAASAEGSECTRRESTGGTPAGTGEAYGAPPESSGMHGARQGVSLAVSLLRERHTRA